MEIIPAIWHFSTKAYPTPTPPQLFLSLNTTLSFSFHASVNVILFATNAPSPNSNTWSPTHPLCRLCIQPHLFLETFPEVNLAYSPIQLTLSYSANSAVWVLFMYRSFSCKGLSNHERNILSRGILTREMFDKDSLNWFVLVSSWLMIKNIKIVFGPSEKVLH